MMLKTKTTILAVIVSVFSYAQLAAQENHAEFSEWPALAAFHEVISNTYHQSEESNFTPIRKRAAELHDKAVKLSSSKIPADLDHPEVRRAMKELESGTDHLNAMVQKNAPDSDLKKMLISVHETFHKIADLCSKGEHGEKPSGK